MNNTQSVMEIQIMPIEQKAIDMFQQAKETRSAIWIKQKQIREILEQNSKFLNNKKKLAAITKSQNILKDKLMDESPEILQLEREIKELKTTLKGEQLTLFGFLDEYTKTGKTAIKIDGKMKSIEKAYKIKKV